MKTTIPPPVILLVFGVAMWFVARDATQYVLTFRYALPVSIAIAAFGVASAVAGIREFSQSRTTVNPHRIREASTLVTTGIYQRTRNPMYVGLLLVLIAWALWLGALANLLLLLTFVVAITELQIRPEEQALAELFGDAYADYCQRVRRWF